MKIVADESVDKQIVDRLRAQSHEVIYIAELDPGIDDDTVLFRSHNADALLITADKDFGELVFRQGKLHSGIVLLRLSGLTPYQRAEIVGATFERHGTELQKQFAVVSARAIRLRRNDR